MEPESSLPHLQVLDSCPYPEPDQSSPRRPPDQVLKIHFNIILQPTSTIILLFIPLSWINMFTSEHFSKTPSTHDIPFNWTTGSHPNPLRIIIFKTSIAT